MKKYITLASILLMFAKISFAQNSTIDSLQLVLKTAKEDTDKVNTLNSLAGEMYGINPDTAIFLSSQALYISEKIKCRLGIARSHNVLAVIYMMGICNYDSAYKQYTKALAIAEEVEQSKKYPNTIIYKLKEQIIANSGINYDNQGNYSKALEYDYKALKIAEEMGIKDGIASVISDIAIVYGHQAQAHLKQNSDKRASDTLYSKALDYNLKALKMFEELVDPVNIARTLDDIGDDYKGLADLRGNSDKTENDSLYSKALEYYNKSLKLQEEFRNDNGIAIELGSIGYIYIQLNKSTEADSCLHEALNIATRIKALDLIRNDNESLSELYSKEGDWQKAFYYSFELFQTSRSTLLTNLSSLSENEKSDFVKAVADNSSNFFSTAYSFKPADDSTFQWLYDYQLFQRGIVLESSSGLAASVQKDTSLVPLWKKFTNIKNIIKRESLKDKDDRRPDLPALEDSANNLEKDLREKSIPYRNWQDRVNSTWQDVQKHLAKDEAAIEFTSFQLQCKEKTGFGVSAQSGDSVLYAALVLTQSMQYPKLVFLFEKNQLETLLKSTGRGVKVLNDAVNALPFADSLYKLIIKPLMPYLHNIKSISFAPDGLLYKISLSEVSGPDGKPLCETYRLRQMLSTRSVVFSSPEPRYQPATLFGGIDYKYISPSDSIFATINDKNNPTDINDFTSRGSGLDSLHYTREEVEGLSHLYQSKKFSYTLFEDTSASEIKFEQMNGKSPTVLHLATHGFYFPPDIKKRKHYKESYYSDKFSIAEDPLLRTGLALAGAGYAWDNPDEDEENDGLLYAEDISRLDLSNTDLVVLSACESALGDIKGSEGVYGLQRAFKMAGVKYMIMSLWDVDDKATQKFMQLFYGKWLSGKAVHIAFQETQKEMVADKYDALKWAAFVLVE